MISNKWLWAVFAFIVVGAFIASDLFRGNRGSDTRMNAGILNGKKISWNEYDNVKKYVTFSRNNQQYNVSKKTIDRETWETIAALHKADEYGITCSDNDVATALTNTQYFLNEQGKFDRARAEWTLRYMGTSFQEYSYFLKIQITLGRLRNCITRSGFMVSEIEVDNDVRDRTDKFEISPLVINYDIDATKLEISEEKLKEKYEQTKEDYKTPDVVAVKYVMFNAAKYVDSVEISEDEIRDYYDSNIAEFISTDTNGVEITKEYDVVKDDIKKNLAKDGSFNYAYNKASEFNDLCLENESKKDGKSFEELAKEFDLTIAETEMFTKESKPVVKGAEEFVDAAFRLISEYPEEEENKTYSDAPVYGDDVSYVICYKANEVSHIPPYEEVKDSVLALEQVKEAQKIFNNKVLSIQNGIKTAMSSNDTFKVAIEKLGLNAGTNLVFSFSSAADTKIPYASAIAKEMIKLNTGDVSSPVYTQSEAIIFEVVKRESLSEEENSLEYDKSRAFMGYVAVENMWDEWLTNNMFAMKLVTDIPLEEVDEVE